MSDKKESHNVGGKSKEEGKESSREKGKREKEEIKEKEEYEKNGHGGEKKKSSAHYGKRYVDETYGEEFDGEERYFPILPPSQFDFDMLMGTQTESKASIKLDDFDDMKEDLGEYLIDKEQEEMEEEDRLSFEDEEPKELTKEKESVKESLASITSSEYGMRITEYYIKPKEKTLSELQFESDYREVIEEKMKKIMRPGELDEEKEKKQVPERKPVEKKPLIITEFDVSGLYPQPKAIESEVSFAFEEDEEGDKGFRGIQTEAEIIMELLRRSLKQDLESIFAKNAKEMIQKVRQVIEEIVTIIRRGVPADIAQKVNDGLSNFKPNLKTNLIAHLKEQLQTSRMVDLEEEEEGKPLEVTEGVSKRVKRRPKLKPAKTIEETAEEEEKEEYGEGEEIEIAVKEEALKAIDQLKAQVKLEKKEVEEEEEEKEVEEEVEEEVKVAYEKIDWQQYLTASERQLIADPAIKSEMELYIRERKAELEKEQKIVAQKRQKKSMYKREKDPELMLRNYNLVVTMKFILNSGETFTSAYRYFMKFKEIKEDLARLFKIPPDVFIIYRGKEEVRDESSAFDLKPDVEPFETVTFRLLTLDNDRWQIRSDELDLPVPDIITCTVETGKNHEGVSEYKEVVVEIEDRKIKKPFVGGYRNCETGKEYHHAFSQSAPHPPKLPWDRRVSRDTQTKVTNEKLIDTATEKSTQMPRRDYYVSTENDKIITAKPYIDHEQWCRDRDVEGKVKTIQKYLRAMILRRFLRKMSEEYKKRRCWEVEQERRRMAERENRIKLNIINMTYPKTRADFDMLYNLVEKWRKAQIERISKLKTEAPKKAELCSVLEKEIKLLEAIEVHRIAVSKEQKRIKVMNFMEKVAAPVTWTGYRGMTIKMDSLKTQRARELKELYQSLSRHDLDYQDRIELLISVKHALRIHCTPLTEELTSLINQESEMLVRGVRDRDLEYLRQRIEHLFQEYFRDPNFNPEAAKHDPTFYKEPIRGNVFCKFCHQMKFIKDFTATSRDKSVKICSTCQWVYNIAIPRIDLNPYRYILKMVRKDEQKRNCYSSSAFILQDEDMRFLVQNIWKNKSAVSENDNLLDLRMPRWNVSKDWTPWNCILLTESEAKAHLNTKPSENYEPQLVGEIISKHELAKRHFQQLFSSTARIRDSGKWANTVDVKEYTSLPATAEFWDIKPSECNRLKKQNNALYEVHKTRRKDEGFVQYI